VGWTFYNSSGQQLRATADKAATQAEMETGTSTSAYVTPGRTQYHPGVAKAWAAYDNDGTFTDLLLYNCATTDTAVGRCAIAFGTDFSGTTWSAAGSSDENASFRKQAIAAGTVDAQFRTTAAQALVDSNFCSVIFFGDQ
jgi:hypothetical protein